MIPTQQRIAFIGSNKIYITLIGIGAILFTELLESLSGTAVNAFPGSNIFT